VRVVLAVRLRPTSTQATSRATSLAQGAQLGRLEEAALARSRMVRSGLLDSRRGLTTGQQDLGSNLGKTHDVQDERDDMSGTSQGDDSARAGGRIEPVNLAVDHRKSEDEQVDDLVAELTALGMNPDREALRSVVRKRSS